MTANAATVIAIDDDQIHLDGLASGLERNGVTCRPIHFTGDATVVPRCPEVRIILADLHLGAGVPSSDHTTDFSTIGHLLEDRIGPSGPYCIVLWTMYADRAPALAAFLERLRNVPKPVVVPGARQGRSSRRRRQHQERRCANAGIGSSGPGMAASGRRAGAGRSVG